MHHALEAVRAITVSNMAQALLCGGLKRFFCHFGE
jgi:hypothetical protein